MYKAIDIARYIICFANEKEIAITNLRLQKLLYYAQAWYLVNFGKPLFEEKIEAWQFGPVIPAVYDEFKSFGRHPIELDSSSCKKIIENEECINYLDEFCEQFLQYSTTDLVSMTHNEKPWIEAFKNHDNEIKTSVMLEYYSAL